MLPLPHSAFPGALFPAIAQTQAASMLAVQYQLDRSERLAPADLRALQYRQIETVVEHVARNVPHDAERLQRAGLAAGASISDETWSRIPVLTRAEVQDAGTRLYASEIPKSHGRIGQATTSGSSGRPITLRKTDLWQFYWQCFTLREELWHRRDWSATGLAIRRDEALKPGESTGKLRRTPGWGVPISVVYPTTGESLLLDYRCAVAEQAETLMRERPAYLTTYPSLLVELLRSGAVPQGLREVRTVGEALSDETRETCMARWGVPITDTYSCAEAGLLAIQCPEHRRYHVQAEGVLLEVLHPDGTPCGPGETGEVLLTTLHNFAMPLIRYAIGDRAEVGSPCPCGRTLPVLARIPGKARGMLVLANGERRFPTYGHGELMRVDAIVQHQVIQKTFDEVEIGLVLRRPLTADEERYLVEAAERALGAPFRARLRVREPIERGPGGKFAEFYSEVDS